jgi:hypothetical protein
VLPAPAAAAAGALAFGYNKLIKMALGRFEIEKWRERGFRWLGKGATIQENGRSCRKDVCKFSMVLDGVACHPGTLVERFVAQKAR